MVKRFVHIVLGLIFTAFINFGCNEVIAQDTVQAVIVFDCIPTYNHEPLENGDTIFAYSTHIDSSGWNKGQHVYNGSDTVFAIDLNGSLVMSVNSEFGVLNFEVARAQSHCNSASTITAVDNSRSNSDTLIITYFDASSQNVYYPVNQICWNESELIPIKEYDIQEISYSSEPGLSIDTNGIIYPVLSTPGFYTVHFESNYCLDSDSAIINIIGGLQTGLGDSVNYCAGGADSYNGFNLPVALIDAPLEILDNPPKSAYYRVIDSIGCLSSDSLYIDFIEPAEIEVMQTDRCNSVLLELQPYDRKLETIAWSDTESGNTFEVFESKTMNITVTDEYGCWSTQSINVEVRPLTVESIDYIKEESDCWYDGRLNVESSDTRNSIGETRFELRNTLNNEIVSNLNQIPEGIYAIEVIDSRNCRSVYQEPVVIYQKCLEHYPVITPNYDGDEDEYFIPYVGTIQVYDRNGKLVDEFEAPAYWDGTNFDGQILPMGNYVMVADNGRAVNITLVR